MKQLAATKAELDGISKIAEHYKDDSHLNGDCREEQLKKYLQSQLNCVLQNTASSSLLPATNTTSASYVDVKVNTTRAPPPTPCKSKSYPVPCTTGSPSPQEIPRKPRPDEKLDCIPRSPPLSVRREKFSLKDSQKCWPRGKIVFLVQSQRCFPETL